MVCVNNVWRFFYTLKFFGILILFMVCAHTPVTEAKGEHVYQSLLNQEAKTLSAFCATSECGEGQGTGVSDSHSTYSDILKICLLSLPEHCQHIKPELTACSPEEEDQSWIQKTGLSAGSCLVGVVNGVVDTLWFAGQITYKLSHGVYQTLSSEEYREEVFDMASFLMDDLQEAGFQGTIQGLSEAVLNEKDKFISCLNYRGKFEYLCEAGSQIFTPFAVLSVAKKTALTVKVVGKAVGRGGKAAAKISKKAALAAGTKAKTTGQALKRKIRHRIKKTPPKKPSN